MTVRHKRRYSAFIPLFLLSTLLVGLFTTFGTVWGQAEQEGMDIILLVDQSGSMCCTPPMNDRQNWRGTMTDLFISFLGVDQSGSESQIGIIYFGGETETVATLQPLTDADSRAALHEQVALKSSNMGWTDHLAALEVARDEFAENGRPGVQQAVVLLTDGEPHLGGTWTDDQRAIYMTNLREMISTEWPEDVPVYTVALATEAFREDPRSDIYKNLWQEIAAVTGAPADVGYQEAETAENLTTIYINIIQSLLGRDVEQVPPPVEVPSTEQFIVSEPLEQVIFIIVKTDADIETTISRPDDTVLACSDPDVECAREGREETISVVSPEEGVWEVALEGSGYVQFFPVKYEIEQLPQVELRHPLKTTHPTGKPLLLQAQLVDATTGELLPVEAMRTTISGPSGSESLSMVAAGDDLFEAVYEGADVAGGYELAFAVTTAEGEEIEDTHEIVVVDAPWIQIAEPGPGSHPVNQPVPLTMQLMFRDQPLERLDNTWEYQVAAQLESGEGEVLGNEALEPASRGRFVGEVDLENQGPHALEANILIVTGNGERFTDSARGTFTVGQALVPTEAPTEPPTATVAPTATPQPTVTPTPFVPPEPPDDEPLNLGALLLGVLVLALVASGGVGGYYFSQMPTLSGELVEEDGTPHPLRGRRSQTIGSSPKANITVHGDGIAPIHALLRPRDHGVDLVNQVEAGAADPLETSSADAGGDFFGSAPTEGSGEEPVFVPAEYQPPQVKGENESEFHPITHQHSLAHNDQIRLGRSTFTYNNPSLEDAYTFDDDLFDFDESEDGGQSESIF